jgi:hypothetical protein
MRMIFVSKLLTVQEAEAPASIARLFRRVTTTFAAAVDLSTKLLHDTTGTSQD